MFFSWLLFGLLVNVPLRSVTALQTYELIAHRHIATTTCIDSRIRQIKRNRALEKAETSNLIAKTKLVSSPNGKASLEEVRVFAHDKRVLLEYLNTLCDDKYASKGHLPKIDAGRTEAVLSSLHSYAEHPEVPPFDVALVAGSELSHNRVALTFFADGYTQSEKANFFEDVRFLVNEISGNQTYHTVAPLMNFWAAFTPSRQSGVGVNGQPKDTPFGLYRDGTELRALYYAHPEVARASCDSLGDKCDFPVLLGNDKLYGGLGGEFTTITASLINGPRVLRHELGHSIINVGEEYDGGFAYFGVNSAPNLSDPLPWGHWLADPKDSSRAERSVMPMQAYPWTLLNSSDPWSIVFDSAGTYSRHLARFSLSGLPESADLTVLFDGEDIDWKAKEGLGVDRWHYDIYRDQSLAPGSHNISFQLNSPKLEGTAQLCSVEILEFGSPQEFNATTGYYGAFPTFSDKNETTYRPTNEDCLMRITNEPNFCKVCIEGLWLSLLERVDLIEDLNTTCVMNSSSDNWTRQLTVSLVPLADPSEPRGVYSIEWRKDGDLLLDFSNKTVILLDDDKALGKFEVTVQFTTPEVRLDPTGLLKSQHEVMISSLCSDISV